MARACDGSSLTRPPARTTLAWAAQRPSKAHAGIAMEAGVSFVSTDEIRAATERASLPPAEA
ncbi:hypothetical protein AB0D04_39720, partial [Streptomyces sp. NPDC048483]